MTTQILSYGGGTQTMAMLILVQRGLLPRPDYVIAADTGREMPTTWQYADTYTRPLLAGMGMELHIASHELATVDLYGLNGDLLVPVFTETGKLSTYCSSEWKARVVARYARRVLGATGELVNWIGYAYDERHRWAGKVKQVPFGSGVGMGSLEGDRIYPLVGLMLTSEDCRHIIASAGLPLPHKSRCRMCPHQSNEEWREVRADPAQWAAAIAEDNELRDNDERGGVWLHHSRIPLELADLDADDRKEPARQCGLGLCMI